MCNLPQTDVLSVDGMMYHLASRTRLHAKMGAARRVLCQNRILEPQILLEISQRWAEERARR